MAAPLHKRQPTKKQKQKYTQSEELRRWAIMRGMTPKDRYLLGPTGNWHAAEEYYYKILPMWCPLSVAWRREPSLPPKSAYASLARGGILETNYIPMHNVWSGTSERFYVCDSEKTRSMITRLQSETIQSLAWRFIKIHLVQTTFEEGWLAIFEQVITLKRKLDKPDWKQQLDGQVLNMAAHLKLGFILDSGLMPPDLLVIALRMVTVWLQDYLREQHQSEGRIILVKAVRHILVVYGHRQLVSHQKVRLMEFYRSNLYRAPAKFVRIKKADL